MTDSHRVKITSRVCDNPVAGRGLNAIDFVVAKSFRLLSPGKIILTVTNQDNLITLFDGGLVHAKV